VFRAGKWNALLFTILPVFFDKHLINNILPQKNHRKVSTLSTPWVAFFRPAAKNASFFQDRIIRPKFNILKMSMFHSAPGVPRRKMERLTAFTGLIHP